MFQQLALPWATKLWAQPRFKTQIVEARLVLIWWSNLCYAISRPKSGVVYHRTRIPTTIRISSLYNSSQITRLQKIRKPTKSTKNYCKEKSNLSQTTSHSISPPTTSMLRPLLPSFRNKLTESTGRSPKAD